MKYPKSTTLLVALLIFLTAAAASPRVAYRTVVTTPRAWLRGLEAERNREQKLRNWDQIRQRAYEGDIDAMVEVAIAMRSPSWAYYTGIATDSVAGESIMRQAAELGSQQAKWTIWGMDGEDPDELMELYDWAVANDDFTFSGPLHGYLHWYGVRLCRPDMRDASRVIDEHVKAQYGTSVHTQQDRFEGEYREACEVH